jgi:signal transduction histidine kinase/CheY-like chemotaxis protein
MQLFLPYILLFSLAINAQKTNSTVRNDSITYYLKQSEISSNRHHFKKAFKFLQKAIKFAEKEKDFEAESVIYAHLGNLYADLKTHTSLDDETANSDKIDLSEFAKFNEIGRLKKQKTEKIAIAKDASEEKFVKLISILSLALISILSLLCLSLYRNNKIRTNSNFVLKEKNKELLMAKENAERSSLARSEFLSTVSHELRTPLNAIIGITHLLLDENPKKEQLEYFESLKFSGNYLLNYINDILEINRIESKNIEIEKINFNLKKLIQDIKFSLIGLTKENNNTLVLEIDELIPDYLLGDPTKMAQIFINLINNALKFTKEGQVKVIAKMTCSENYKTTIHFQICDSGIGIPDDKLESIFESFSQGSVEINRKYGGTGLGLTIVKSLILILGGEIKLTSQVGVGSIFSFNLDFEPSEKIRLEKPIPIDENLFTAKTILLVEDNKINQMITKRMLEKKKIICEMVENGEDAVEITKTKKYDLILMDVHLPGINGTIAAQLIRKNKITTPIIALTAISLDENREMLVLRNE